MSKVPFSDLTDSSVLSLSDLRSVSKMALLKKDNGIEVIGIPNCGPNSGKRCRYLLMKGGDWKFLGLCEDVVDSVIPEVSVLSGSGNGNISMLPEGKVLDWDRVTSVQGVKELLRWVIEKDTGGFGDGIHRFFVDKR